MRKLLRRLGVRKLSREEPVDRLRRGQRLGADSKVGLLVPAVDQVHRLQLKDLVAGLEKEEVDWFIVADTGLTRKAHAKARAQRIQKLGLGQEVPPDFPQLSRVHCFWRDECTSLGLPTSIPDRLDSADVLLTLDSTGSQLPLRAMMRRAKAPFKVGPMQADDGTLDFMLTWPDGGDMLSFVQVAFHYLKTLDLK